MPQFSKNYYKNFIRDNETDKLFKELLQHLYQYGAFSRDKVTQATYDRLILIAGQWKGIIQEQQLNISNPAETDREKARINHSIFRLINDLPDHFFTFLNSEDKEKLPPAVDVHAQIDVIHQKNSIKQAEIIKQRQTKVEKAKHEQDKFIVFWQNNGKKLALGIGAALLLVFLWKMLPTSDNDRDSEVAEVPVLKDTLIALPTVNSTEEAESRYNQILLKADESFKNRNYVEAKQQYREALAVANGFSLATDYAERKIKFSDEAIRKLAEQQSTTEKRSNYNKWEAKGDNAYKGENYSSAKEFYLSSADFINDSAIKRKIKNCEEKIAATNRQEISEQNYQKYILKGNKYLESGDYERAKSAYENAKKYKNTNEVNSKIASAKEQLQVSSGSSPSLSRCQYCPEMVFVKWGTFDMGCTSEQSDCGADEKPVHTITLSDFSIGKYEVTQKE